MTDKTLNWLNILHFYQPPFQDMEIVRKVTEECYLPVSALFLEKPHAKAVVNINGCLLELLDSFPDGNEVIRNLKSLAAAEQVEITGTGKYHPIFPLISTREVKIQVLRQEMSLNSFLDVQHTPVVMFLPELAYWPEQTLIFEKLGYNWIIIDEISVTSGKDAMGSRLLREKGRNMNLLVRERDVSESLCNFPWRKFDIRTPGEFLKHSWERIKGDGFIVTASDAEVFGHHQKGRWKLMADIYEEPSVKSVTVNDIVGRYDSEEVETVPASWSTSMDDISDRIFYPLWHHPRNRLHQILWQLLDSTLEEIRGHGSELQNKKMDTLLSSCPFFWASCMPWWYGIMVEDVADRMFALLSEVKDCPDKVIARAEKLREDIYSEVAFLNKTGKAEQLQNEYLHKKRLSRNSLHHLIH